MREEIGFGITIEQRLESCPDSMLLKFATFGKKVRILVLINYVGPEIGFAIMVGQNLDKLFSNVQYLSNVCPIFVKVLSMSNLCPIS